MTSAILASSFSGMDFGADSDRSKSRKHDAAKSAKFDVQIIGLFEHEWRGG